MNLAGDARHTAAQFGTPTVRLKPDTTYRHGTASRALGGLDVPAEPSAGGRNNAGYAMAALLVAMSVMAVVMSVAMPTWSHMIRREKEEELIFRGNQYARAIGMYQSKYASASPPSLDILIEQRLLRKKFKDPLSPNEDGEFELLYVNSAQTAGQSGRGSQTGGVGSLMTQRAGSVLGTKPTGAIMGVVSKNTGESIRTFNGKNHYNEWQFVAMQQSTQAGGAGGPGQGRGTGPPRGTGRGSEFIPASGTGRGMQPSGRGQQQQQQGGRGFSQPPGR